LRCIPSVNWKSDTAATLNDPIGSVEAILPAKFEM
jgi:hypothetical protein